LNVYIEGDGKAWSTRYKLSSDPTPNDTLALKLAILDKADNVIYLARPCQYRSIMDIKCQTDKRYWSSHRYSSEVVSTYIDILEQLKKQFAYKQFHLFGFSGGGVISSLLAASRADITALVTISANLDHQYWAKMHNVSQLSGSLNLYNYLEPLSKIKQFHFSGAKDKIVPAETNLALFKKLNLLSTNNIHNIIVEGYNHSCCWEKTWPDLLTELRAKLTIK